jgi:hypothetical protein
MVLGFDVGGASGTYLTVVPKCVWKLNLYRLTVHFYNAARP